MVDFLAPGDSFVALQLFSFAMQHFGLPFNLKMYALNEIRGSERGGILGRQPLRIPDVVLSQPDLQNAIVAIHAAGGGLRRGWG